MIERGKSILLTLLVMTSLLQSYLLAFQSGDYESIREGEYISTEIVGTQEKAEQLVYPSRIAIHRADDRHTVLYPGHYFYKVIMEELQHRQFDGLRVSARGAGQLKRMINVSDGIEIRFTDELPLSLIRHSLPVNPGIMTELDRIGTIWITEIDGRPGIYLIGEDFNDAYEVLRTDLDTETVAQLVGLGDYQKPYLVSTTGFLYPAEPVKMYRYVYPLDRLSVGNMENMLFPDPGITRNWESGDGTQIYSDGKRGMEVESRTQWMRFSDPLASTGQPFDPETDMAGAVQYVNRHGGWNGLFSLERVRLRNESSAPHFTFRQWLPSHPENFPILHPGDEPFGTIDVLMEGDTVTEYERSLLIVRNKLADRSEVMLPGGEELKQIINASGLILRLEAVIPAYRPRILTDAIEFDPIWAAVLNDGTMVELN
jgi:regulatory protein YycH of two-component signal transduction system YycFG